MPVRPVVTNTTPLVSLWLLDRLDILRSLFGETIIPPGVQSERQSGMYLGEDLIERVLQIAGEK